MKKIMILLAAAVFALSFHGQAQQVNSDTTKKEVASHHCTDKKSCKKSCSKDKKECSKDKASCTSGKSCCKGEAKSCCKGDKKMKDCPMHKN